MTPLVILGVIEQALRVFNNITEGKSLEQRQAEALIGFSILKPLVWPFLPKEVKEAVNALMDKED